VVKIRISHASAMHHAYDHINRKYNFSCRMYCFCAIC